MRTQTRHRSSGIFSPPRDVISIYLNSAESRVPPTAMIWLCPGCDSLRERGPAFSAGGFEMLPDVLVRSRKHADCSSGGLDRLHLSTRHSGGLPTRVPSSVSFARSQQEVDRPTVVVWASLHQAIGALVVSCRQFTRRQDLVLRGRDAASE